MNEEKVRNAVKVANELVPGTLPEFMPIWRDIFSALTAEPYPYTDNRTATAAEFAGDEKQK